MDKLISLLNSQKDVAQQYLKKKTVKPKEYWEAVFNECNSVIRMIEKAENEEVVLESVKQLLQATKRKSKKKSEKGNLPIHEGHQVVYELILSRL